MSWPFYELIWRRFVASQMTPAVFDLTTWTSASGIYLFSRPLPRLLEIRWIRKLYQEVPGIPKRRRDGKFPPLAAGMSSSLRILTPHTHQAPGPLPPEASSIKELEVQGIGRPSTIRHHLHQTSRTASMW